MSIQDRPASVNRHLDSFSSLDDTPGMVLAHDDFTTKTAGGLRLHLVHAHDYETTEGLDFDALVDHHRHAHQIPEEAVPPAVSPEPTLDPAEQIARAIVVAVGRATTGLAPHPTRPLPSLVDIEAELTADIREALRSYR